MATSQPIRVAIIGTAKRPSYLYGPLLKGLPEEVELVAVWGRNTGAVRQLGKSLGTPWYTDLARLVQATAPQISILSWSNILVRSSRHLLSGQSPKGLLILNG
jgi:predicted dehydrogenase